MDEMRQGLPESGPSSLSMRIPWTVWCVAAGATSTTLGLYWDISWHMSIGRDSFWTPAHVAIYLGGILAGLSAAVAILPTTFRRSARAEASRQTAVRIWGFQGSLGAFICAWGAIAMLTSAPFDNWWHNAYGLDVKILSPPHVLLLLGILAIEFGSLLLVNQVRAHAATGVRQRLDWLVLYIGGLILSTVIATLDEPTNRLTMHSALPYSIFAAALPILLLTLGSLSNMRWGCTMVTAVFTAGRLAQLWILPLFPAEPKLGPVFQHVTRFIPMAFPWLIMVPAIVLDVLRFKWSASKNTWSQSVLGGAGFLVTLLVVQWPFATFLMGPSARNWFFGTHYIPFNVKLPFPDFPFTFAPMEKSAAEVCWRMIAALLFGILSVRMGVVLSARLVRLRR